MIIDLYKIKRYIFSRKASVVFYTKKISYNKKNYVSELRYVIIRSYEELDYYSEEYKFNIKSEHYERLKNGSVLFLVLLDDIWVSYGWGIMEGIFWISEIDWLVELENSESVILYDFYTKSEYRGKGIYPLLLNAICNDLKKELYIIFSYESNLSSRKGIEKAHFSYNGAFKHKNKKQLNDFLNKYNIQILDNKLHFLDIFSDRIRR